MEAKEDRNPLNTVLAQRRACAGAPNGGGRAIALRCDLRAAVAAKAFLSNDPASFSVYWDRCRIKMNLA